MDKYYPYRKANLISKPARAVSDLCSVLRRTPLHATPASSTPGPTLLTDPAPHPLDITDTIDNAPSLHLLADSLDPSFGVPLQAENLPVSPVAILESSTPSSPSNIPLPDDAVEHLPASDSADTTDYTEYDYSEFLDAFDALQTPLYINAAISSLEAVLLIHQYILHSNTNKSQADKLLKLISALLPGANSLPNSYKTFFKVFHVAVSKFSCDYI